MDAMSIPIKSLRYELRFGSLFNAGRAFVFPCDAAGRADCAGLTEAARRSYRLVCASVRREVSLAEALLSSADRGR
jgi:hypothetical protein